MLKKVRMWVGGFVRRKARREVAQFFEATRDCRGTQRQVLQRLLQLNGASRFGYDHKLGEVRTPADLRARVPVSDFEHFRSYVEQLRHGDCSALLGPRNRLLMFTLSSGTTAESKFIPITTQFIDDYRRGWRIWGIRAFEEHPEVLERHIVQLGSDHDQFRTPAGTPCGNISGLVSAMQSRIVRLMYTVPQPVAKIKDYDIRYYTTMRIALADRTPIGCIMTANPSTLIRLAKFADAEKEHLIRDIADGTLAHRDALEPRVRRQLRRAVGKANRQRARELERIVSRTGSLLPKDYWPGLALMAVWTGGSVGAYLPTLRRYYGDCPIRDHGLSASEGRMTIPFRDEEPGGVLDINTHYFEFIPEEEYGSPDRTILEAHELEAGRSYYILLTTASGLWRYDIRDVVRCVGFENTTPVLEFLHKGAHIANVTGEKVAESQVAAAVRQSIESLRLELDYFTLSPKWGDPPQYQLFVSENYVPEASVGARLAEAVDTDLQELNCEYREKRLTGRLGPIRCVRLPAGTFESFAKQRQSRVGGSVEQYKHPCLVPDLEFADRIDGHRPDRQNGKSEPGTPTLPVGRGIAGHPARQQRAVG